VGGAASTSHSRIRTNGSMRLDGNGVRILYICGGRSFFGKNLNRKIVEVADCWRRAGHDVKHVCGGDFSSDGGGAKGSASYGLQETFTRWYRKAPGIDLLVRSASERRDIRHHLAILEELKALVTEFKPDIVWERSCRLHCPGLEIAKHLGVPYVLEWKDHLVDYRLSLFRGRALRMEARKNREADHIVVESGVLRDELGRKGVDTGKIIVAHNAVQADQFSRDQQKRAKVRSEIGVDDDTVLAGYLGSYAFYHDTARLVLAADIIRKSSTATKTKILMVGAGKEYPDSRRLAEERGLLDDILIMKPGVPKDEVPGILAALDIAVLPGSTDVICPIKVQEYMACELPSVVPDYACNREVIDDNRTGMLFRPRNERALAEKISILAHDSKMRLSMGREARKEIVRCYTWEKTWGAALNRILRAVKSL